MIRRGAGDVTGMPEMNFVYSSHIVSLGYDAETAEFHVRFGPTVKHPGGRTAVYHDVPPDVADAIMRAPSAGQAVHNNLRDAYPFSYL
jgi:hypothetical protein